MKQTLTSATFSFLFLFSGISASASTYSPLDTALTKTDTNEVEVEIEGIDPDSGLVSALSEIIAVSTKEATKLAARIAEVEALVEAGSLTEEEGEARIEALEAEFEAKWNASAKAWRRGVTNSAIRWTPGAKSSRKNGKSALKNLMKASLIALREISS